MFIPSADFIFDFSDTEFGFIPQYFENWSSIIHLLSVYVVLLSKPMQNFLSNKAAKNSQKLCT